MMFIPFMHPSDRELVQLADGDVSGSARARLNAHLGECHRCRDAVQGTRDVTRLSDSMATPPADDDLLARILERRAAGERVILPDDVPGESGRAAWPSRWRTSAVAAAAVLSVGGAAAWRASGPQPELAAAAAAAAAASRVAPSVADDAMDFAGDLALSVSPWPAVAQAQRGPTTYVAPALLTGIDGRRLKEARWSHVHSSVLQDSISAPGGVSSTSVAHVSHRGRAAVLLVSESGGFTQVIDTLLLDPVDLRPLEKRWYRPRGDTRVVYRYDPDGSVLIVRTQRDAKQGGRVRTDTLRSHIVPRGLVLVHESQLHLLFQLAPLRVGWRGTVGRQGAGNTITAPPRALSITLGVVGEETLRHPRGGSRDVWRIAVVSDANGKPVDTTTWFVDKRTRAILRATRAGPHWNPNGEVDLQFRTDLVGGW